MHIAWLWYIYKLSQGYFQYVFVGKPMLKRDGNPSGPAGNDIWYFWWAFPPT